MTVDEARALMNEWTQSPALRVHMEAGAACMGAYADKTAPDQREPADGWFLCRHSLTFARRRSRAS